MAVYSPSPYPRLKAAAVGFGQAAQNIQPQPVGSQRIAAILFSGAAAVFRQRITRQSFWTAARSSMVFSAAPLPEGCTGNL